MAKVYDRKTYLEITENLSQKPYIELKDALFLLECEWYRQVSQEVPDTKSFLDLFEGKYIAVKDKSDLEDLLDRRKIPDMYFGLLQDSLFLLLLQPYNRVISSLSLKKMKIRHLIFLVSLYSQLQRS